MHPRPFAAAAHAPPPVALDAVLQSLLRHTGAAGAALLDAAGELRCRAGDECCGEQGGLWRQALEAGGVEVGTLLLRPGAGGAPPDAQAMLPLLALAACLLENERLYEEARQARQEREHFLVALHHEVRTPATALVLEADALRSGLFGALPPEACEVLQRLEERTMALVQVLDRVAELGRLAEQAAPARVALLEPRDLARRALLQIEPLARRKGLRLALHAPAYLPPMQTDVDRLFRALGQLLANAVRFTGAGEVAVHLSHHPAERRNRPVLEVAVQDSGPGIPPEQLERVLEPFAQAEEGARSLSGERGTGLGLALARRLVQTLGGELRLHSEPGRGTRAVLRVPYSQEGG